MRRFFVLKALFAFLLAAAALSAQTASAQPVFSKAFGPNSISAGANSELVFTITNSAGAPVDSLAFTDTLPVGVSVSATPQASTTCIGGTLTAPSGGGTISYSGGSVAAGQSCTLSVLVTSSTSGSHVNVSGDLTSSAGNSGPANATLNVAATNPTFSKAFSAGGAIPVGATTRLTFALANPGGSYIQSIAFTDVLPDGLQIADPANIVNTCTSSVLTAPPGGTTISYTAGLLMPATGCDIALDIRALTAGTKVNTTEMTFYSPATGSASTGIASDSLSVTAAAPGEVQLVMDFVNDPVAPGTDAILEYTFTNKSRSSAATSISVTDTLADLPAGTLRGAKDSDTCGGTITGDTINIPTLASSASCTIGYKLAIPGGAGVAGVYNNSTGPVLATIGGAPVTSPAASASLTVSEALAPVLEKSFLAPVAPGEPATMRFKITNPSVSGSLSSISFTDDLGAFLSGATASSLPASGFCGAGSNISYNPSNTSLTISSANLAPSDDCSFDVVIDTLAGTTPGDYTNTTSPIEGDAGGTLRTGAAASGTLTITGSAKLTFSKQFSVDTALAGDSVQLSFRIASTPESSAVTGMSFTDDVDSFLSGTTITSIDSNSCGAGSIVGGNRFELSNGTLSDLGDSCDIVLTLQLPDPATPGTYANTAGDLSFDDGTARTLPGASDTLRIASYRNLEFSKRFVEASAVPGGSTTLEFTITNPNPAGPAGAASGITFTDGLSAFVTGASATSAAQSDICGTGSSLSGTNSLVFSGGSLNGGESCTFDVTVAIPVTTASGTYTNRTSNLLATISASTVPTSPAVAGLSVIAEPLQLTKSFTDDPADAGGTVTLEFTLRNDAASEATNIAFSDDLDAALSGLAASGGAQSNICGAGSSLSGTSTLSFTGGRLAAGASCSFSATLQVPAGVSGSSTNTTSAVTGTVSGAAVTGPAASDTLTVRSATAPLFAKSFANGGLVTQGQSTTLTFTIENRDSAALSNLRFTDDLSAMLPGAVATGVSANSCGGSAGGTSLLTVSGASVAGGATCTIAFDLDIPAGSAAGNHTNRSSDLTGASGTLASPAEAVLRVQPLPGFAKSFADANPAFREPTTLSLTIDNSGSALPVTNVTLSDPLTGGLQLSGAASGDAGCSGTVGGAAGETSITFSGSVPAGAVCTISGPVIGTVAGTINNEATLNSDLHAAPITAMAGISVAPPVEPVVGKSFSLASVDQGQSLTMTVSVENPNLFAPMTNVVLSDAIQSDLAITTAAVDAGTGCSRGTISGAAGATSLGFAGDIAPGETCTIDVGVTVTGTNNISNTVSVTSDFNATARTASASLTVRPADGPAIGKSFSQPSVEQGGTVTLTLALENTNAFVPITGAALTDIFPAGLVVASAGSADAGCTGGTLSAAPGDTAITWTGGTVAIGAICTITADVTVTGSTDLTNTVSVISDQNSAPILASANLSVTSLTDPVLTKAFSTGAVVQGEDLTMTLTVTNPNAFVAVGDIAVTDSFPAGLVVSTPATLDAGCDGGTLSGGAGATDISYTGGSVAGGATCTINVGVTVTGASDLTNTALLTSELNTVPTASSANLSVTPAPPPGFAKTYAPATIFETETTRVTYRIDNSAALVAAADLAFSDSLDASITVADPANVTNTCGGTLNAATGGSDLSYSGGTVAAGASCEIGVDLVAASVGSFTDAAGPLTSTLGSSGMANATLTVQKIVTGEITIVQRADPDGAFQFSSAESALNFRIQTAGGTGSFGPVKLPAGTYRISQTPPEGFGNVAISCSDSDSTGDTRERRLTISLDAGEAVTCTIASIQTDSKTVETINKFLFRRADMILSSEPTLNRRIDRLLRGFDNASALRFSTGDLMAFSPFRFDPMSMSPGDINVSGSLLTMRQAAASLKLAHGASDQTAYVSNYRWDAWFEAQYKKFDDSEGEGDFGILHFGADYLVNENLLVGIMGQVDRLDEASPANNTTVGGTGWMAGPYMTARLSPNLYFDARVAAGTSVNEISPFNTYTDEFDTTRWLAMMNLTGEFQRGPWSIRPNASLAYYEEKQSAYTDSLGVPIPSQTVGLTQFKLGPTFVGRFEGQGGITYEPNFSLEAIYNMGHTMGVTLVDDEPHSNGWRGRFMAGITMTTEGGARFGFGASFDGLFRDDYESYGLSVDVSIPLTKPTAR